MVSDDGDQLNLTFEELVDKHKEEGKRREAIAAQFIPESIRTAPASRRELHPIKDAFVSDLWSPRSDIQSMEHPIFSLNIRRSKDGGTEIRTYEHNGSFLEVKSPSGIATQLDKDILIVCMSHIIQQINEGITPNRTILVKPYDILVSTNRGVGGRHYQQIRDGLRRLHETTITTNIKSGRRRIYSGFSLIDHYTIHEGEDDNGNDLGKIKGSLQITISEWLFNAILAKEVIKLPRHYFHMTSPLMRRVWELCAKHLGKQDSWKCRLSIFHKKTGYAQPVGEFKRQIKNYIKDKSLPDFKLSLSKTKTGEDMLIVRKHPKSLLDGSQGLTEHPDDCG